MEALNLTDDEIYRDMLRPGSGLSHLSDESPIRPLRPVPYPQQSSEYFGQTPNHLRTSRFSASPYPSRYLQDSAVKPSDFTFTRQLSGPNTLEQLSGDLTIYVQEANTALEKCAEAKHRLAEEREAVIHLAQQLATEEAREISLHLDRHRDSLQALLGELRNQSVNVLRLLNNRESGEAVVVLAKQKAERAIGQLRQEISRRPIPGLGTEVLSKQAGEDLHRQLVSSESEIDRLKSLIRDLERQLPSTPQPHTDQKMLESALESLRKDHSSLNTEKVRLEEENFSLKRSMQKGPLEDPRFIDSIIASRIEEVTFKLNDRAKGYTEAWKTLKDSLNRTSATTKEEVDISHLQSIATLARLKDSVDALVTQLEAKRKVKDELSERVLVTYKQSALSELRSLHLKSEEQSQALREQVRSEERHAVKADLTQLREANQKLSDILASQTHQLSEVREKFDSLSGELSEMRAERSRLVREKEEEVKGVRAEQEKELERRLRLLKLETEDELRRAREQLEGDLQGQYGSEITDLTNRNSALEREIAQLKQDLNSSNMERERLEDVKEALTLNLESDCARKLEQMRRVYTDKYDELYRITTSQINELEMKLQQSEHSKVLLADSIKSKVIQSEESTRARQFEKLNALHRREVDVISREIDEFVRRAKGEIGRMAVSIEDALKHSSEHAVLRGVRADLCSLAGRLEFRIRKPQESMGLISETKEEDSVQCALIPGDSMDMRICKRCGSNDKVSPTCQFHPYLVKAGAADYLYGAEWHHCREDKHRPDDPPCLTTTGHYYGPATVWSPNNQGSSGGDSLSCILNQESLRPDGFTFGGRRVQSGQGSTGSRNSPRRMLDNYDGPEKEKIISAVKDIKQRSSRSSRKVSPSQSQGNLQATGAFTLPVQTSPPRGGLDSALFESEKQVKFERPAVTPEKQSLRIPGAHTVLQKQGDEWATAGLVGEDQSLLPSEQLEQYLSRR